jgi:hypothetical protein
MYISRLRKHAHTDEHTTARRLLVDRFGLGDNPDVLWAFADALYTQFQWADCFAVTERLVFQLSVLKCRLLIETQDIGPGGLTYSDNASAYRMYVPPETSAQPAICPGA